MTVQKIQQLASIGAYLMDVKCALEVLEKREQEKIDLLVQPKRMFNLAMVVKRMTAKSTQARLTP